MIITEHFTQPSSQRGKPNYCTAGRLLCKPLKHASFQFPLQRVMTVNVRLLKLLSRGALCLPFDSSVRALCGAENGTFVVLFTMSHKTYARTLRKNVQRFGRILSRVGNLTEALCFVLIGKRSIFCWHCGVMFLFFFPTHTKLQFQRRLSATLNLSPRLEKHILQESPDI